MKTIQKPSFLHEMVWYCAPGLRLLTMAVRNVASLPPHLMARAGQRAMRKTPPYSQYDDIAF